MVTKQKRLGICISNMDGRTIVMTAIILLIQDCLVKEVVIINLLILILLQCLNVGEVIQRMWPC